MNSIQLYAELLLNIKTVTFFANLRSEHNHETTAEISADGKTITVRHEGESAHIKLPTRISGGGSAALTLPAQPSKDLTLRLKLEEKAPGLLSYSDFADERSGNPVPWDATALDTSCTIQCTTCGQVLIAAESIREWKDLPNANWAEMMDFWHCHKPEEQHDDDGAPARKGYAAGTKLVATPGIGFVDAMYFLCASEDCSGIQQPASPMRGCVAYTQPCLAVSSSASERAEERPASQSHADVRCAGCQSILGSYDTNADGVRLLKWAIAVQRDGKEERHDLQRWISAQLLGIVENTAARKFIIRDQAALETATPAVMLWIFTPDLSFSSSVNSTERSDPTRAMKVFWMPTDEPDHILATQSSSFEEVLLPTEQFQSLKATLDTNSTLLPRSARSFQQWRVSLLSRFAGPAPGNATNAIDPFYE